MSSDYNARNIVAVNPRVSAARFIHAELVGP